jgi:hypothetical protein
MEINEIGTVITEKLGLDYLPVCIYFSETRLENGIGFIGKRNGYIMSMILAASKGKIGIKQNCWGGINN